MAWKCISFISIVVLFHGSFAFFNDNTPLFQHDKGTVPKRRKEPPRRAQRPISLSDHDAELANELLAKEQVDRVGAGGAKATAESKAMLHGHGKERTSSAKDDKHQQGIFSFSKKGKASKGRSGSGFSEAELQEMQASVDETRAAKRAAAKRVDTEEEKERKAADKTEAELERIAIQEARASAREEETNSKDESKLQSEEEAHEMSEEQQRAVEEAEVANRAAEIRRQRQLEQEAELAKRVEQLEVERTRFLIGNRLLSKAAQQCGAAKDDLELTLANAKDRGVGEISAYDLELIVANLNALSKGPDFDSVVDAQTKRTQRALAKQVYSLQSIVTRFVNVSRGATNASFVKMLGAFAQDFVDVMTEEGDKSFKSISHLTEDMDPSIAEQMTPLFALIHMDTVPVSLSSFNWAVMQKTQVVDPCIRVTKLLDAFAPALAGSRKLHATLNRTANEITSLSRSKLYSEQVSDMATKLLQLGYMERIAAEDMSQYVVKHVGSAVHNQLGCATQDSAGDNSAAAPRGLGWLLATLAATATLLYS